MKWPNLFSSVRREPAAVEFPLQVNIDDPRVRVTIHSHDLSTAAGTIGCWTYVTDGLVFWGQKEIVVTIKRERHEPESAYPAEPIEFLRAIAPYARAGTLVETGGFTQFGTDAFWGGHVLYAKAQPLGGLEIPEDCLAALFITANELEIARSHGPTRVMARLGREAAYFPYPPWCDRARLRSQTPTRAESILDRVPRVSLQGVSAIYDRRNVWITVAAPDRPALQRAMTQWSIDEPLALLTGVGTGDGCLVWEPGLPGIHAITPPNSNGTHLAGCFLMIAGGLEYDEIRIVEDGICLILTREAVTSLREVLLNGGELRLPAADGAAIFVENATPSRPPVNVVLLYPDAEWQPRGVDPHMLSLYMKDLQRVIDDARPDGELPRGFDIVVALRGGGSRVWSAPAGLRERLENVQPPAVVPGPFAFVLTSGDPREQPFDPNRNFPAEWQAAAGELQAAEPQRTLTIDDVIAQAWPPAGGPAGV